MDKLSIVILSYNTKKLTLDCIESVFDQYSKNIENGEFEIIVADNASTDGTPVEISNLKSKISNLKLIQNKNNFGFSKGNNAAVRDARGKYILFLNSDTQVKDKELLSMIDFLEKNPKVGILGGKIINNDQTPQPSAGKFYTLLNLCIVLLGLERLGFVRSSPSKISRVDWVSGAFMMIGKDLFDRLGGFDEHLFMYLEDMELCYRAKKEDFLTYFYPNVKLMHKKLGSSNKTFAIINIYKGILYFYKKHKSWQYLIVKVLLAAKALVAICIGVLTNSRYLRDTYRQGLRIAI